MKTADPRARARGRLKHRYFGCAATVDHSHALAPFEACDDGGNRIVGDGEKNQVGTIDDILRVRCRAAIGNWCRQLLGRAYAAAGGGDDAVFGLREAPSEAFGDAAGTDETDARWNLNLPLHLVHR